MEKGGMPRELRRPAESSRKRIRRSRPVDIVGAARYRNVALPCKAQLFITFYRQRI